VHGYEQDKDVYIVIWNSDVQYLSLTLYIRYTHRKPPGLFNVLMQYICDSTHTGHLREFLMQYICDRLIILLVGFGNVLVINARN